MSQLVFLELGLSFCTVVDCDCHVSKAAKILGVTQPAVTMQLRRLEGILKKQLFEKKGSRLQLTHEGYQFYVMISGYSKTFSEFETVLRQYSGPYKKHDELKLLGNQSSYHFILPKVTKSFLDAFPKANVCIYLAETPQALDLLQKGEVDVAILPRRAGVSFPESVDYYPVFFYQPCLITLKDHPLAGKPSISLAEIADYDLILPAPDLIVIPNLYDIFPKQKKTKKLKLQMKNVESGRKFVEAGVAITISSDIIIEPDDPYLVATPLSHLFPSVDYGLVVSKSRPIPSHWESFKLICEEWEKIRISQVKY